MPGERPRALVSRPVPGLKGRITPPGDKSISHRALILGALAVGETMVTGLLEGDDVLCTAAALRQLGAGIERRTDGSWRVAGPGVGGLHEPADVLDLGNSGTGARLLMGAVAAHPFTSFFTGDASLRGRPMGRVIDPLRRMGAEALSRQGDRLPLALIGRGDLLPITYELPVASAQVKSAILLAGLNARGKTSVIEPAPTRDHTENLLRHFGAEIRVEALDSGGRRIVVTGQPELTGSAIAVPGDPSSAAFPVVAALITPGSDVTIENVGLNPLRDGLFRVLRDMGADIALENARRSGGEPVADLRVRASALAGVTVDPALAPAMIDEYPVLAVAAAFATGTTDLRGIAELRVKESDRIAATVAGLRANGVRVDEHADGMTVHGTGTAPAAGGQVAAHHDHRIAMAFLTLGCGAKAPVTIDDGRMIDTSFPGFANLMSDLGCLIVPDES